MEKKFKIENNILKGIEVPCKIGYTSLGNFIMDRLEGSPDFVGQINAVTGEKYTYEQMRERSVRCALWMKSQGLLPGDLITICSHEQLDITMPFFAALYIGAVANVLHAKLTAEETVSLMRMTKPKMAFVSEDSVTAIAEAAKVAELDLKIVVFGQGTSKLFEFESILAEANLEDVKNFECTSVSDPDRTAFVVFSSGTTGLPKGVAHSHKAMFIQLEQSKKLGVAGNRCLTTSTLYWISGIHVMFMSFYWKTTRITVPHFDAHTICESIKKYQITWILFGSGAIIRLLKSGALEEYDFSHVKRVCHGGTPLALSLRDAFANFVPNALITLAYGMTELCGLMAVQTADSKPGSVGQLLDNTQVKVIDLETGRTLGANEKGEILVKATSIMNYYCDDPQGTAAAFDEEGWLRTGDLGHYDEDGEIFVVQRLKDLMKCRGCYISAFEIEAVIYSHPGVNEVAVVGVPHPVDGQHPVAFVVREPDFTKTGKEVTEAELMDLVAAELPDSKRLRGGVRFLDSLPRSPSSKIRRAHLRVSATHSS